MRELTRGEEAQMTDAEVKREFIDPQRHARAVERAEVGLIRAAIKQRRDQEHAEDCICPVCVWTEKVLAARKRAKQKGART